MKFFEKYFSDSKFDGQERVKVKCPFHNDTVESAVVNADDSTFHCFACGDHFTEQQFIARINGTNISEAGKVLSKLEQEENQWNLIEKAELWADNTFLERVRSLGLSDETIDKLNLGLIRDEYGNHVLGFPVFYNGVLMDVRKYNIAKIKGLAKIRSDKGAEAGLVIPYDLWQKDSEKTYIFEGEKDMAIARELGLNAITLTGGAHAKPNELVVGAFKGRDVVICYDNDDAGRKGAIGIYHSLKNIAKDIKYVNIGEIATKDKGDIYDAVTEYNMDLFQFLALDEHDFDDSLEEEELTPVKTALHKNRIKQKLKSIVTVNADFADTYAVPVSVSFRKMEADKNATMIVGEERSWYLDTKRLKQVLELIEIGAREKEVFSTIKGWLNIPKTEKNLSCSVGTYQTIYKVRVIDANSNVVIEQVEDFANVTLDLYAFNPLNVGGQYYIDYIIFPHPTKNQKLVAVASDTVEINAEERFKISRELLAPFAQKLPLEEKINMLYESAKHHVAPHLNFDLWLMADLVFNSILEIEWGDKIRGALDVFILGDTQVGKSETTSKLTQLYNFGHFLSLKTSTTVGLIGGSQKVDNSLLNTIGAIPRQHKKLVVLEEFSGAPPSFINTMTDIRTSGIIRLTRIAGELNIPCRLRTITISNPINDSDGNPRYLSTFPNGVAPLMELIKSAEDVGRYDAFLLIPRVTKRVNPFMNPLTGEPIPQENYAHKAQWVYTRKASNVTFEKGIQAYIWDKAEELNKDFESNFPLFGTTTNLKLARFSVALASLVFNTTDDFQNIVVTKEIVDYVVDYLKRIYDNEIFKLREYREEYESYSNVTQEEVTNLQRMYPKNAVMLDFLMTVSNTSSINLRTISGLDGDKFNPVFSSLVKMKYLKLAGQAVFPTPKFRKAMGMINKKFRVDAGVIETEEIGLTWSLEKESEG